MTVKPNPSGWDISVHSRNGQLVLVVEVKSKLNTSPEWAARLRRNILAHGTFPKASYFLMAFPDRFYLWTNAHLQLDQVLPTYTIDAFPILQPYFEQAGVTFGKISEQSFELIISSWLQEIVYAEKPLETVEQSQGWLINSGLYDALTGGKVDGTVS